MNSFEVWLPLGALALYLFDSIAWLYSNELIFLHGAARWRSAHVPAFLVAGRRVYVPNPLTPTTPLFKVRWSESDPRTEQEDPGELERFLRALRPVQFLVNILLVILLVLPVELILYGTGVELLVVMGLFYFVIMLALVFVYRRRGELRLSGRAFAALCFDSLACAPFAINLVRKLALRRSLAGNPIDFAAHSFAPPAFADLIHAVTARLAEEQLREDPQSPRWVELDAYRQQLESMAIERLQPPV